MIIRSHIVRVDYLDYGSHLDTSYYLGVSVEGGRVVIDSGEYRNRFAAEAAQERWFDKGEQLKAREHGCLLEKGEEVHRKSDMNPHGLI